MKSFKTHLVEERRQLDEVAFVALLPILGMAASWFVRVAPLLIRVGGFFAKRPLQTFIGGIVGTVATRYFTSGGEKRLLNDLMSGGQSLFQLFMGSSLWVKIVITVLLAMAIVGPAIPKGTKIIRRALRRRGVYEAIQQELEEGDLDAAQAILVDAVTDQEAGISLIDMKKVMSSKEFDELSRGLDKFM